MRQYKKEAITIAFTEACRLSRKGEKVIITKLPSLNSLSCGYFKEAVTHSFNYKTHGFNLERIFKIDENGFWHQLDTKNPKDHTLIDLIIKAMIYIGECKRNEREVKKSQFVECSDSKLDDSYLINVLKSRGYVIFKQV